MHWSLDDWNRYNYVPGLRVVADPAGRRRSCAAWGEELEAIVEVGGLFDLTMHPFISGRPARAAALETADRAGRTRSTACGSRPATRSPPGWGLDLPPVTHEPPTF